MKDNTLVKILAVLIVILIIGIFAISKIIGGDSKEERRSQTSYSDTPIISVIEHETKYDTNTINIYYAALTTDDRDRIDELIDSLIEQFNQKNYDELYSYLNIDYFKCLFEGSKENFKKYIDQNFDSNCYCIDYRISAHGCFINLGFEGDSSKKLEVQIQNYKESAANGMMLFFDDIIEVRSVTYAFQTEDIVVKQSFMAKYPDKTRLYLNVRNKTNHTVTVDFANTEVEAYDAPNESKAGLLNESTVTVSAGEEKRVEFDFDYPPDEMLYDVDTINYKLSIGENEYEKSTYIFLSENELDY